MKKHLIIAACLLVAAIQSCKKETTTVTDTPVPAPAAPLDNFKLTVSDTLYDPVNVTISHVNGKIVAESDFNEYTYFKITIDDQVDADTYGVDASSPFRIAFSNDSSATMYYSTGGAVTIKSHDVLTGKISGTFYATLTAAGQGGYKPVTGGEFNITY